MAIPVPMPKLAMGHTEGQVIEWLVDEGAWVEKGQQIMVVETEKVAYETESPASGYLHHAVELNATVPVLETVALLAETEEELAELQASVPAIVVEPPAQVEAAVPVAPTKAAPAPAIAAALPVSGGRARTGSGKIKISPVAKKWALEHNLDLNTLRGSGPGGRIVKRDVDQALQAAPAVAGKPWTGDVIGGKRVKVALPLSPMRKAIAEHMQRSLAGSAQLSFMGEIDMTEMIRLRRALLRKEEEIGLRVTYTDLFVYTLARAVKQVPIVNASLIDGEIKIWEDVNIGVAVALEMNEYESGLIVPVVQNAGRMTLTETSHAVRDLTLRAREGNLTLEDVGGGTITLSNAGAFATGWGVSTPILNAPEVVLVQPGGIFDQPVVVNGEIVIRPIMTLSITCDHRVLDGVPMSKLFNSMKELMENPAYLHL